MPVYAEEMEAQDELNGVAQDQTPRAAELVFDSCRLASGRRPQQPHTPPCLAAASDRTVDLLFIETQ